MYGAPDANHDEFASMLRGPNQPQLPRDPILEYLHAQDRSTASGKALTGFEVNQGARRSTGGKPTLGRSTTDSNWVSADDMSPTAPMASLSDNPSQSFSNLAQTPVERIVQHQAHHTRESERQRLEEHQQEGLYIPPASLVENRQKMVADESTAPPNFSSPSRKRQYTHSEHSSFNGQQRGEQMLRDVTVHGIIRKQQRGATTSGMAPHGRLHAQSHTSPNIPVRHTKQSIGRMLKPPPHYVQAEQWEQDRDRSKQEEVDRRSGFVNDTITTEMVRLNNIAAAGAIASNGGRGASPKARAPSLTVGTWSTPKNGRVDRLPYHEEFKGSAKGGSVASSAEHEYFHRVMRHGHALGQDASWQAQRIAEEDRRVYDASPSRDTGRSTGRSVVPRSPPRRSNPLSRRYAPPVGHGNPLEQQERREHSPYYTEGSPRQNNSARSGTKPDWVNPVDVRATQTSPVERRPNSPVSSKLVESPPTQRELYEGERALADHGRHVRENWIQEKQRRVTKIPTPVRQHQPEDRPATLPSTTQIIAETSSGQRRQDRRSKLQSAESRSSSANGPIQSDPKIGELQAVAQRLQEQQAQLVKAQQEQLRVEQDSKKTASVPDPRVQEQLDTLLEHQQYLASTVEQLSATVTRQRVVSEPTSTPNATGRVERTTSTSSVATATVDHQGCQTDARPVRDSGGPEPAELGLFEPKLLDFYNGGDPQDTRTSQQQPHMVFPSQPRPSQGNTSQLQESARYTTAPDLNAPLKPPVYPHDWVRLNEGLNLEEQSTISAFYKHREQYLRTRNKRLGEEGPARSSSHASGLDATLNVEPSARLVNAESLRQVGPSPQKVRSHQRPGTGLVSPGGQTPPSHPPEFPGILVPPTHFGSFKENPVQNSRTNSALKREEMLSPIHGHQAAHPEMTNHAPHDLLPSSVRVEQTIANVQAPTTHGDNTSTGITPAERLAAKLQAQADAYNSQRLTRAPHHQGEEGHLIQQFDKRGSLASAVAAESGSHGINQPRGWTPGSAAFKPQYI